ncbi:MAG: 3-methyladenine DNA glycosylase [Poseidonibacter sp.]|uniref:3-methyladenine DNA glycosylase n=2 Tax=Poseidonibacter sp. TaxID=2321188 RepID=UPI00359E4461
MISILNSYDLFIYLKDQNLIDETNEYWWPSSTSFEVLLGAILTQNTKWTNVEKSLENLKKLNINSLENLANIPLETLTNAITPSGFKNQKAIRLILLANNILDEYSNFENFCSNTTRDWLLGQKGIGAETADAILCYCCKQDFMVVDSYTNKLLKRFGYEFESYEELQGWCEYGINENYDKIAQLYNSKITLNKIYARFHGKIIEFMKRNPKG